MQYLTFFLGDIEFAVDVRVVETVVEYTGTTPVPTPLEYVRGVMDLRGRTVAVVDLGRKFALTAKEPPPGACVIVLALAIPLAGGETVGALVDAVSEVVSIDRIGTEEDHGERTELWRRYVRGIARVDGRMVILIDSEGLFSLNELAVAGREAAAM
jgi:purine-binding chemotaxis protein CheW